MAPRYELECYDYDFEVGSLAEERLPRFGEEDEFSRLGMDELSDWDLYEERRFWPDELF